MAYIYALADPETSAVRYVGQARNWRKRYAQHCLVSNSIGECRRARWLRSLLAQGLKPNIKILEEVEDTNAAERKWIAHYKAIGAELVNGTDGGDDMGHIRAAKASTPWAGTYTPLQRAQMILRDTLKSHRRFGSEAKASRVERQIATLQRRLVEVRRAEGQAGIERINDGLYAKKPDIYGPKRYANSLAA